MKDPSRDSRSHFAEEDAVASQRCRLLLSKSRNDPVGLQRGEQDVDDPKKHQEGGRNVAGHYRTTQFAPAEEAEVAPRQNQRHGQYGHHREDRDRETQRAGFHFKLSALHRKRE